MSSNPTVLFDNSKNQYSIKRRIGSGGEGDVYEINEVTSIELVAKIYKESITDEKIEKLLVMVNAFDDKLQGIAAWPRELLMDKNGHVRGFLMPRVKDHKPIHELFNPSARKKYFPSADWAFLVNAAKNTVAAFHTIHSHGFVVGDVNEGNLMVSSSSTVKFIDCDSFQVSKNGKVYPCEVGVPMYTPPELQARKSFRDSIRTVNHDVFGMAVICFQLLFMGRHPYVGIYQGPDITLEKAIENYLFAYSRAAKAKGITPPPEALNYDSIPPTLKNLFEAAFTEAGISERPSSIKWFEEFSQLKSHIKTCRNEAIHKHHESLISCPWCDIENSRGIFFFMSSKIGSFNLKGFNLEEIWSKIMSVSLPNEEMLDYSKIPITSSDLPLEYSVFRILQYIQRISAFVIPIISLSISAKLFLFSIPIGIILYNLKVFDKKVDAERDKRRNSFEYARAKWVEIQRKWSNEASPRAFEQKLKELKEVKNKYERLGSEYSKERQLLHLKMEELQLHKFLSNFFIKSHSIPSIGETRKLTLSSFGIDTAADVNKLKRFKVPGFGSFLEGQLFHWRNTLAKRFKFDPSRGIDPEDVNHLNRKFENLKLEYQNKLAGGIEALMTIKNLTLRNRASMRSQVEIIGRAYHQAEVNWKKVA